MVRYFVRCIFIRFTIIYLIHSVAKVMRTGAWAPCCDWYFVSKRKPQFSWQLTQRSRSKLFRSRLFLISYAKNSMTVIKVRYCDRFWVWRRIIRRRTHKLWLGNVLVGIYLSISMSSPKHFTSGIAWVICDRGGLQFCRRQKSWDDWCPHITSIFAVITPHLFLPRDASARLCHNMSSVRLSVCNVEVPWSLRFEYFENNYTAE